LQMVFFPDSSVLSQIFHMVFLPDSSESNPLCCCNRCNALLLFYLQIIQTINNIGLNYVSVLTSTTGKVLICSSCD
jgi:hypothetical protein